MGILRTNASGGGRILELEENLNNLHSDFAELEEKLNNLQVGFATNMSLEFRARAASGFSAVHGALKVLPVEWVSTETDKAKLTFRYVFHKKCRVRLRISPFTVFVAGSPYTDFAIYVKGVEKIRKFINKNNTGPTSEISATYVMEPNDTIEFKFLGVGFSGSTDSEYVSVYNSYSTTNTSNTYLLVIPIE